jgi:hypothetical protein
MFSEIVNKYEKFSDGLISKISYKASLNSKKVEVIINSMNKLNNYQFETIKLIFTEIVFIQFREKENQSSTLINSAFLANNNGIMVFDFFPLIYENDNLRENDNSDFKIKCKEVKYVKIKTVSE